MAKKYRVNFRLPDGRRGVTFCQTQAEANLTKSMVGALIAAVHSGIVNQDALIWASRLPAEHYQKLVRWGLLTERSVGITVTKLIDFVLNQKKAEKTILTNTHILAKHSIKKFLLNFSAAMD